LVQAVNQSLTWEPADALQDQDIAEGRRVHIVGFGEGAEPGCNRCDVEVSIGGREENCRLYHTVEEL